MLIYMTHMHPEASSDPEHCTPKSDAKAMSSWLHAHIKTVDQYEDIYSPKPNEGYTYIEEDTTHIKETTAKEQSLPPSGT